MAVMVPPEWADVNGSPAEGHVYRSLQDETPDDWYALHSVGLTTHSHKSWAEVDFVIVGPFGVLCLEVKGGRITVNQGRWATNDHEMKQSPFAQAGGGAGALRRDLRELFPPLRRAIVEYAVAFPDVRFKGRGPSIEPVVVYDADSITAGFEPFIKQVAEHWREFRGLDDDRFRPISRSERSAIVAWFAPSFDTVPSLQARIADADAEFNRLTETQARVLRNVREKDRAFIRGGAGTGKTLLAVDEASRLAAQGGKVLLCCRSKPLAGWLGELTEDDMTVEVEDFGTLASRLVDEGGRGEHLPDADDADLFNVFLPAEAAEAALELEMVGSFDALVVDEGQDLVFDGALDLLDLLLDGGLKGGVWRFFLDHKQNVFSGLDRTQLERLTGAAVTELDLVDNCRSTPQIATTTAMLAAVPRDSALARDGPEVEIKWALDQAEEYELAATMLGRWIKRGTVADQIVLLGEGDNPPARLLTALPASTPVPRAWNADGEGVPAWWPIEQFKGLESAAVIVTGIHDLNTREMLRRVYVACSRARTFFGVVLNENLRDDFNLRATEYARRYASDPP